MLIRNHIAMGLNRYWNLAAGWKDVAREVWWQRSGSHGSPEPLAFPLDPTVVSEVEIRWPVRYQWDTACNYVNGILTGCRKYARVVRADLPQPYNGIVMIQVGVKGKRYDVAIDYFDDLNRITEECLSRSALYFKMQYRCTGYGAGEALQRIIPGGFVPGHHRLYRYLPYVREVADQGLPAYDVYGRFGLEFAKEIRQKAVTFLRNQNQFRYEGGLKKVRYSRSLAEVARAKICIDLPSNSDFCFRLIDYLAVGACIIGPKHRTMLHVPLQDRVHIVYTKNDLSDLIPLCKYYLEHDHEREMLRRNSRNFFDRWLHRDQLAAYYLHYFQDLN